MGHSSKNQKFIRLILTICCLLTFSNKPALAYPTGEHALPTLMFLYPEMAPSIAPDSLPGSVKGKLAERIQIIAGKAGIALRWDGPLPRNRIVAELERDGPVCTPNVLKTAERTRLFKFTRPILPAPDWVVVVRAGGLDRLPAASFTDLIRAPGLIMSAQQGSSYSADIDHMIEEEAAHIRFLRGEMVDVLHALAKGYADYTITTVDELQLAESTGGYTTQDFDTRRYPDLVEVGAGHIMCSRGVSDEIIAALDRAIGSIPVTAVDGEESTGDTGGSHSHSVRVPSP